jgi:hypothetical protein
MALSDLLGNDRYNFLLFNTAIGDEMSELEPAIPISLRQRIATRIAL